MADDTRPLEPAELIRIDAAFPRVGDPVTLADRADRIAAMLRSVHRRQRDEAFDSADVEAAIEVLRGRKDDAVAMALIDRLHKLSSAIDRLNASAHSESLGLAAETFGAISEDKQLCTEVDRATLRRLDASLTAHREGEAEARRRVISGIVESRLVHVPYRIVQDILGVDDGGYASIFDSEAIEPYGGRFANRVGGPLLEAVIDGIGRQALEERSGRIGSDDLMPEIGYRLPGNPDDTDFAFLGKLASAATIAHLQKALDLPEGSFSPELETKLAAYCVEYARSEYDFVTQNAPATP